MTSPSRRTSSRSRRDTVTCRAARATSSPARTRAYARWPPTLIALTALGTWEISPVKALRPARIASSSTSPAGAEDTTGPSASSVTVACPSRIVAAYPLSAPITYVSNRVARPTPSTSTPVAIGSSVPPCPTRRVFARRRIRATTSCEAIPVGLTTAISAVGSTRRTCHAGTAARGPPVRRSADGSHDRPAARPHPRHHRHEPDQHDQREHRPDPAQPEPTPARPPHHRQEHRQPRADP